MRFGVLGTTTVTDVDGNPHPVAGPRVRALLALLLMEAGKVISAEQLISRLYGADAPAGATGALQSQVSRLRRELRDTGCDLEYTTAGYRLSVDPQDVDVCRFESLAASGRRALSASDDVQAARTLTEALSLWRGPALSDIGDAPFAPAQVARLDEARLTATADRIEADLRLGRHADLVTELTQLVADHPLRERLRGQLMRALYGCGRQAEALTAYEDARRTLADELGTDPSAELSDLHRSMLRADPALLPVPAAEVMRRGIPAQLTSFIGRDQEIGRVPALLSDSRLVTLIGPGGVGKTRLAIEVVEHVATDSFFVDLSQLSHGTQVPRGVLDALGLRDARAGVGDVGRPAPDATARLKAALLNREALLILDNGEHVIADLARLAGDLLAACPKLRILVTSREAVGVTGETLCPVPRLDLPPADSSVRQALGYSAVRLFCDRAVAVAPDFTIDQENLSDVLRICRALDGLPLAVELAAARIRSMSARDIAIRLVEERFPLLSKGSRTASPRHQTLRAVVAWSWDLLDEAEQVLARRLTVFSGGAGIEAVQRICGGSSIETLDLLTSLSDKSFVEVNGGRYRMLETIGEFCAERLAEADETQQMRQAHLEYFLELAELADPELRGPSQLSWLARLDAERANLRAAVEMTLEAVDPQPGMRLIAALSWYWWLRGQRNEGSVLARRLLRGLPAHYSGDAYVLCVLNALTLSTDDESLKPHRELVEARMVFREKIPDHPIILLIWSMLAGPPPEPGNVLTLMLEYRSRIQDAWARTLVCLGLGYSFMYKGDFEEAQKQYTTALEGFRELSDRWGSSNALVGLANLAIRAGDLAGFSELTAQAIVLLEEIGSTEEQVELLCDRAENFLRAGLLERATEAFGQANSLTAKFGTIEATARTKRGLGEIARLNGDLDGATRLLREALDECVSGWFMTEIVRVDIYVSLGRVAHDEGDVSLARRRYRQGLGLAQGRNYYRPGMADAVNGLAGCALAEGDGEEAATLLGAAAVLHDLRKLGDLHVVELLRQAGSMIGQDSCHRAYETGRSMTGQQIPSFLERLSARGE